jgi:putative transposase
MYGHHYSKQTVSNLTQLVSEDVRAFHERKLEKRYVCIYLDATHIPIRRQTVEKEAVYIAIGITEDGTKEVLDSTIAPTESSHVWEELIQRLKGRGVENVLLFISDGLPGMTDAIHRVYPKAKHQVCCVHVARNILVKYV